MLYAIALGAHARAASMAAPGSLPLHKRAEASLFCKQCCPRANTLPVCREWGAAGARVQRDRSCHSRDTKEKELCKAAEHHAHAEGHSSCVSTTFRQRENTQRVVVPAITPPREHALGRRFRGSRTPKHAEGCRSCDHEPPGTCRRSPFLHVDNAKTRRGLSFVRSRHPAHMHRVIVFAFDNAKTRRGFALFPLFSTKRGGSRQPYPVL